MLTVNIKTKDEGTVVAAEVVEADEVYQVTTAYKARDDAEVANPGITLRKGDKIRHIPTHPDFWFEVFVMNDAGKTVARYTL